MLDIWNRYKVTWIFLTKLCASVPADPAIIQKWLESRKPKAIPPGARTIDEIQEEVVATIAAEEEQPSFGLVFQRQSGQLVMRAATVKAHIKDCARVLSNQHIGKIENERAFSTRIINGVYPDEQQYWIPILRPEGDPVMEADGRIEKAIHVRGPRGEQLNALKMFEFVEPARLDFTLKVLKAGKDSVNKKGEAVRAKSTASIEDLETLFMYGGVHGYAGERGDGEGRYFATIEEVK